MTLRFRALAVTHWAIRHMSEGALVYVYIHKTICNRRASEFDLGSARMNVRPRVHAQAPPATEPALGDPSSPPKRVVA